MPKIKQQNNESENIAQSQTEVEVAQVANKLASRDSNGLLNDKAHVFTLDGFVDWRKMIDSKYLVANLAKFPDGTHQSSLKVDELEDSQLLILLGGIKDLANIRGYTKLEYKVHSCSNSYVAVSCKIKWLSNYETNFMEVESESLADAHLDNTKSFAKDFLMAIAENRAFVRAVRNFLRINIVGSDEMGDSKNGVASTPTEESPAISSTHPSNVLKETMDKTGITFEKIKTALIKEGVDEASQWNSVSDIPNKIVFSLIQRLKKKYSAE
jgi:hypothetical protein